MSPSLAPAQLLRWPGRSPQACSEFLNNLDAIWRVNQKVRYLLVKWQFSKKYKDIKIIRTREFLF